MTIEHLKTKAEEMSVSLSSRIGSEPHDILVRLEELNMMLADSSLCLANARYLQDNTINDAIISVLNDEVMSKASASIVNQFIKSKAKEINYIVNLFDRINSTIVHQIDSLRSILSFQKATMSL